MLRKMALQCLMVHTWQTISDLVRFHIETHSQMQPMRWLSAPDQKPRLADDLPSSPRACQADSRRQGREGFLQLLELAHSQGQLESVALLHQNFGVASLKHESKATKWLLSKKNMILQTNLFCLPISVIVYIYIIQPCLGWWLSLLLLDVGCISMIYPMIFPWYLHKDGEHSWFINASWIYIISYHIISYTSTLSIHTHISRYIWIKQWLHKNNHFLVFNSFTKHTHTQTHTHRYRYIYI